MHDKFYIRTERTSWDYAPDWAVFSAEQPDGQLVWFEYCPVFEGGEWRASSGQRMTEDEFESSQSLEARPVEVVEPAPQEPMGNVTTFRQRPTT